MYEIYRRVRISFSRHTSTEMVIVVHSLVFGLQLSICRALVCSSPFKNMFGVCLHSITTLKSWCEAQHYCTSIGGELVRGTNYLQIKGLTGVTDYGTIPNDYWIGMTDLLTERYANKSGWLWTDGSVEPRSSELPWGAGEPSTGGSDCLSQCGSKVCDRQCKNTNYPQYLAAPMCQPRSQTTSVDGRADFQTVPILEASFGFHFSYHHCDKTVTGIETVFDCSVVCLNEPKDWCVAFYFNKAKKQCRPVLYTDATIYMGKGQGWIKYAMRK